MKSICREKEKEEEIKEIKIIKIMNEYYYDYRNDSEIGNESKISS